MSSCRYVGPLCGECDSGFGHTGDWTCDECMPLWADVIIFIAVVVCLSLVLAKAIQSILQQVASGGQASSRGQLITTAKTLLSFLQLLSLVLDFNLNWPSVLGSFLAVSSGAGGANVNFTFLSCILKWNEQHKHLVFSIVPAMCLLLPAIALSILNCWHMNQRSTQKAGITTAIFEVSSPRQIYATVVLFLLFLVYPSTSRQALRAISCYDVDGQAFLSFDLGVPCDSSQERYKIVAWLQVVFISFGIPTGLFLLLYRKRNQLQKEQVRRVYHFLYSGYTPTAYWFECVRMLLKGALVASATLLVNDAFGVRTFFGLLVLLVGLAVQLSVQPYVNGLQAKLELASFLICVFFLLSGLFFASETGNTTGEAILLVLGITFTSAYLIICMYTIAYDIWQSGKATKLASALKKVKRGGSMTLANAVSVAMQDDTRWGRLMDRISRKVSSFNDRVARGELCSCSCFGNTLSDTTAWEAYTADDGDQYYFNRDTEETTWDKPAEVTNLEAWGESVAHAWIMQASKDSGLRTYFNTITQFRTDERPELMPLARAECWEIKIDPQVHVPYYHNTLTHENEFLKPMEFVPTERQMNEWGWFMRAQGGVAATTSTLTPSAAASMSMPAEIEMSNPFKARAEATAEAAAVRIDEDKITLQPVHDKWARFEDTMGKVYWQCASSGESIWDDEYTERFNP